MKPTSLTVLPALLIALLTTPSRAESPTPPPRADALPPLAEMFTWRHEATGSFIKPVLQIASALVNHFPDSATNPDLADRTSTLLIARLGLEGRAWNDTLKFKTIWERNLGYSVARNGPLGTSIWEGTGSFSTRESSLELARWGFTLTAGIFTEPASVDFASHHTLDLFGMDPFVRDPMIQSGFNLGQGLMLRYALGDFALGLAYTGGNPLISSMSGAFGGDVTASGSLYDAPLRDMSSGLPGSNIDVDLFSASLTFSRDFGAVTLGARLALQLYFVDADVTQLRDQPLDGYNVRLAVEARFLDDQLRVFGGYARRANRQLAVPDLTTYKDDFEARIWHAGVDLDLGPFGFGGSVYALRRLIGGNAVIDTTTVNIGATYWIVPTSIAAGLRYAQNTNETQAIDRAYTDTRTLMLSLRLLL